MKTEHGTLVIARTQTEAQRVLSGLTLPLGEETLAVGVKGATYHTFSRVFISGDIKMDDLIWNWLMREVHLYETDVRWF